MQILLLYFETERDVFLVLQFGRIQTWYVEIGDMYGDMGVWAIILLEILYAGGRNLEKE